MVVAGAIVAAMVTHGFRDERSYQAGWAAANAVRPGSDHGQTAEYICAHQLDRSQLGPNMDWDDYLAGCADHVREVVSWAK